MRPRKDKDLAFLDDIREACALILERVANKKLPDFVADRGLQDGIGMRLIIIGEASKNLTDSTKHLYPTIQWRDMARLRDLFVHRYWSIDALKMWEIVNEDIPNLFEILTR